MACSWRVGHSSPRHPQGAQRTSRSRDPSAPRFPEEDAARRGFRTTRAFAPLGLRGPRRLSRLGGGSAGRRQRGAFSRIASEWHARGDRQRTACSFRAGRSCPRQPPRRDPGQGRQRVSRRVAVIDMNAVTARSLLGSFFDADIPLTLARRPRGRYNFRTTQLLDLKQATDRNGWGRSRDRVGRRLASSPSHPCAPGDRPDEPRRGADRVHHRGVRRAHAGRPGERRSRGAGGEHRRDPRGERRLRARHPGRPAAAGVRA